MRYDLGKGVSEAKSNSTVILDMWHSVTVSRTAKNASLSVDGNPPVSVVSPGTAVALDVNSNFFLGGVHKLSTVNPNAVDNDPTSIQDFSGCINQLKVCKITLQSVCFWVVPEGRRIGGLRHHKYCSKSIIQPVQIFHINKCPFLLFLFLYEYAYPS